MQVCRIEVEVSRGVEALVEVSCAITSVTRERAGGAALALGALGHREPPAPGRSVTLSEDAIWTRSGSGRKVPAALCNAAFSQLPVVGSTNIVASLRRNLARVVDLRKVLHNSKN